MIRIGPSGNSVAFYDSGRTHTFEEAEWLNSLGLNAFEYSFGRGVNVTEETCRKIKEEFSKYDVAISAHAPYYTNFSNLDPAMIAKSINYVESSIIAVNKMGGSRVVVHPAACGKADRADAVKEAKRNLDLLAKKVDDLAFDFKICLETMGKHNQIGTAEEVIDFCTQYDKFYPCFDFGHINAYLGGGIKTKDDYKRIIDLAIEKLGFEKAKKMHVHFSKIQYGDKGELRHLTFADDKYGPEYAPLAEVIDEYKLCPYVICESDGTMAVDALAMKNMHKSIYND